MNSCLTKPDFSGNSPKPVPRIQVLTLALAAVCLPVLADGWTLHQTTGQGPSERSAPAVAAVGSQVFLFGGVYDDPGAPAHIPRNDLYRFDTRRDRWTPLQPSGAVPPPRSFAASAAHPPSQTVFVFGGGFNTDPFYSDFTVYGDLWAYNIRENAWTEVVATNPGPSARSRPAAWMVGHRLYVFGGISAFFSTLNDLWVYDLQSNSWTEMIPNGAAGSPPPRHEALSGSRPHGGRLILYGGETLGQFGFETLGDTWEYHLAGNRWVELTPSAPFNIDPPRNLGCAGILQGDLYIHGGDVPGGEICCGSPFPQKVTNELWRFDRHCGTWKEISDEAGAGPFLKRHRAVEVGNKLYVFSGYDFTNPGGQAWNLGVYSFRP